MDVCFYYLRQFVTKSPHAKVNATTTDSLFQAKIKNLFPQFMKDPKVIMTDSYIVDVATGGMLELNRPWAEVEYVLMPLLPTNRAHWMLGCLAIRKHILYVFHSSYKTYREKMVHVGIEPFVKIIPQLLVGLGIWKKTSDDDTDDPMRMTVMVAENVPHQQNGYTCDFCVCPQTHQCTYHGVILK